MLPRRIEPKIFLWGVLAAVSALNLLAQYGMCYSGDDFSYLCHFRYADGTEGHFSFPYDFPKFIISHWLDQNGRVANYCAALLLYALPERVVMILNGLVQALMLWLVMAMAGCRSRQCGVAGGMLLLGTLCLGLPWWDSMQVFDCSVNYVWSTVVVLLFLRLVRSVDRGLRLPAVVLVFAGFVAGAMHEAAGLPLLAGISYLCVIRKRLPQGHVLKAVVAFGAGVIWCVASPGIIARAGETVAPDDTPVILLLKSCPITLLLMAVLAFGMLRSAASRKKVVAFMTTPWSVFAVASVMSACICAVGGIVGRSGWFSQVFALIALWRLAEYLHLRLHRITAAVIAVVVSAVLLWHYQAFAARQLELGSQVLEMRRVYAASPDGQVFMPGVSFEDSQSPLLLSKPRGVPDADDMYQIERFGRYYSRGVKPLVVIPFSRDLLENINLNDTAYDSVSIGNAVIANNLPYGVVYTGNERERTALTLYTGDDGVVRVVIPIVYNDQCLWLLIPRIIDPGDR